MKGSRQRIVPASESEASGPTLSRQECEERLRFETLLTDLSSRFCTLPPEKVDSEIEDTLRQVCENIGLGLSAVWERKSSRPDSLFLTHLYRAVEGPPVPETMEAREVHPWSFDQVLARRTVVLNSVEDAPPEAARDLETWHH